MRLGFVGLGNMGMGMARNLVKAGFETVVRDVRPEAVDVLVGDGATAAATSAEVGDGTDVVCVAVFDEQQIRDCVVGTGSDPGILSTAREGAVLVLHPTVSPVVVREMAAAAGEKGVRVVDAAMSGGGDVAATAGTLTFLVGGDDDAVAFVRPVLDAMSTTVHHIGALGSGVTAKIVSNFLLDGNITLVREALRIAADADIDESRILEVIGDAKVGSSWVSENWRAIRGHEESSWNGKDGVVAMYRKDLQLALSLAESTGVDTPVLRFIVTDVVPLVGEHGVTR
jgi:3-hydroxyisobutyrate dehydrogenase-like beta-hydroxyacid dehydrogenase